MHLLGLLRALEGALQADLGSGVGSAHSGADSLVGHLGSDDGGSEHGLVWCWW